MARGGFPGMGGNMQQLMKQAQKMQQDVQRLQQEISEREFAAAAGGGVVEIEHFRRVRTYEEGRLCLEFAGGLFTVYGDGLRIETLAAHRITLRGRFLRTEFSSS